MYKAIIVSIVLGIVAGASTVMWAVETPPVPEQAPREPLLTFATSGGDILKPAFDDSAVGHLYHDPGIQNFWQQCKAGLFALIKSEMDEQEQAELDCSMELFEALMYCPIAGHVYMSASNDFPFQVIVSVDAGERKSQIETALKRLVDTLPQESKTLRLEKGVTVQGITLKMKDITLWQLADEDNPVFWGWHDNRFLFIYGHKFDEAGTEIFLDRIAETESVLPHLRQTPTLLEYSFKSQTAFEMIRHKMVDPSCGEDALNRFNAALDCLGLTQLGDMNVQARFAEQDIEALADIHLPQPYRGIAAQIKPLDLSCLSMADARATSLSAWNVDLAGVYDVIMATCQSVLPAEEHADMQEAWAGIQEKLGFQVHDGLLAGLSGPMMVQSFSPGAVPEAFNGGFMLVADVNNSAAITAALTQMETLLASLADGMLQVKTMPWGGSEAHAWTCPPLALLNITPMWTIRENRWILCSNVPLFQTVLDNLKDGRWSPTTFTESPQWRTIEPTLPDNMLTFEYGDTRAQLHDIQAAGQRFWPMFTMLMQKEKNVPLPALLPMVDHISTDWGPYVCYTWTDGDTIRVRSRGPLGENLTITPAATSLGVSILLPALGRAREQAKMVVCANNLHQIGIAAITYHEEHHQFPPSLQSLVEAEILPAESLRCPADCDKAGDGSYVYRGADLTINAPAAIMILAHDKYGNHSGCRNILFADGHVTRLCEAGFKATVAKDNQKRKELGLVEIPADGPADDEVPVPEKESTQPGKGCSTF
ncbi:MAG: DUF1559 domain-containing protein [Sedimentisphaerales bacterium]|nr:DUF1559 domain-containing protein [Sedimentisphaerales bacterium]